VGNRKLKLTTQVAIIDTGTSYLLMPKSNFKNLPIILGEFEELLKIFA
jgi:predicted aspartyl protease